jgi:EAL and modified HD-GYP domain-containing signal transduction protein
MDIESLVSGGLAFINYTREALVGRLATLLPPKTTVVEILETVEPDADVIGACLDLRKMGYRLALDDFIPRQEMQPLLEIASYVKVDFRQHDKSARKNLRGMTRNRDIVWLAEKIEDEEEFRTARSEGYTLFQGYFFCRPTMVSRRSLPPSRKNYLRLLGELTRRPLNLDQVLSIVEKEASLCYRLLRLANSPLWGIQNGITSVLGALLLVGEERFRLLVSVAAAGALGQDQSSALVRLSLERARFCELLASAIGENPTEQFMLGLLSLLDAMLATPMEAIAQSLPLRPEAKEALLGAQNRTAMPLCLVRSFELGERSECGTAAPHSHITEEELAKLYMEAVRWARESIAAVG